MELKVNKVANDSEQNSILDVLPCSPANDAIGKGN